MLISKQITDISACFTENKYQRPIWLTQWEEEKGSVVQSCAGIGKTNANQQCEMIMCDYERTRDFSEQVENKKTTVMFLKKSGKRERERDQDLICRQFV